MDDEKTNNYTKIQLKIKKYLELDHVNVLTGAGTSFHLGAPIIRTIPSEIKPDYAILISKYFKTDGCDPSYEDFFNCLQAEKYLKDKKGNDTSVEDAAILKMQQWLFKECNTDKTSIPPDYTNDDKLKADKYFYHKMFIKKILQRSNNLNRVNLFTMNYDMAFDYALDDLGVHYINGFMGVHHRCFRPEVYDYDVYYPGQSTTGKVHRAEKVLRYYKLHGSLSWKMDKTQPSNLYGISEMSLNGKFELNENEQIVVYPCATKKSFTLDLPYSELFRHFSSAINQPQSVLFCIGYSFYDEHINDIIYQALSIPSFTLIVANFKPNEEINKLKALNDPRIIVLDENDSEVSSFVGFVKNIMPDLYELNDEQIIAQTMKTLYKDASKSEDSSDTNS